MSSLEQDNKEYLEKIKNLEIEVTVLQTIENKLLMEDQDMIQMVTEGDFGSSNEVFEDI